MRMINRMNEQKQIHCRVEREYKNDKIEFKERENRKK